VYVRVCAQFMCNFVCMGRWLMCAIYVQFMCNLCVHGQVARVLERGLQSDIAGQSGGAGGVEQWIADALDEEVGRMTHNNASTYLH
jgi:hypothetical protein